MTELFNPFTGETVEFSKAVSPMYGAKDAYANQPTKTVAMLVPTGKHVSHANALHHVKTNLVGRMPRGGKQTLTHVRGTHAGGFGKRDLSTQPGMINPGITTHSWTSPASNMSFASQAGRKGSKVR